MSGQFNDYHNEDARIRLQKIHDKRTSSSETIEAIIAKGINRKLSSYDRIINGEVNEVYAVTLDDNSEIILRIGHIVDHSFEAETWAISQSKMAGVPVANILAIGTLEVADKPLHYSIQEKLNGKRFDTLLWSDRIPTDKARKITEQAGEILARIHNVSSTTGYGSIDENGHGRFPNVSEWVKSHLDKQADYEELFAKHNLTPSTLKVVLAKLKEAEELFGTPHLLHCDFGPKHLFVDENDNITGVIDFERAESGDIALDFASWDYWFSTSVPTKWLYDGYQRVASLGDNFTERLKVVQLHELLHLLNYYTNVAPAPEAATSGAAKIRELVG